MIRSIRRFLLISLLISITIASSITAIGNYLLDKQIIQPYLDEQLIKIAYFIKVLTRFSYNNNTNQQKIVAYLKHLNPKGKQTLVFQVWSPDGKLLLNSTLTSQQSLKNVPLGFNDIQIKGNDWRTLSKIDQSSHNKIIVAELYDIRNKLSDDITRNNAYILLVTYPIFGALIWVIVGLALRSITQVTTEISTRASTYLEPVDPEKTPEEIKPLISALNELFIRLRLAFDRNKRFSADAAHELRTPLAALKTQAQVALKATNSIDRQHALEKVVESVDRSSHMVTQLLTLSRWGQEITLEKHDVDLHKLATEVIAYLVPIAVEKNIDIELAPPPSHTIIEGNETTLSILIRNIVDNAIRYTPAQGAVKVAILNQEPFILFRVIDTGPGIPPELRERVFERFFRVMGTTETGSGLGLAIVQQIAELHHAKVILSNPNDSQSLQFDVLFRDPHIP